MNKQTKTRVIAFSVLMAIFASLFYIIGVLVGLSIVFAAIGLAMLCFLIAFWFLSLTWAALTGEWPWEN